MKAPWKILLRVLSPQPSYVGDVNKGLLLDSASPNWVSSDAKDTTHRVVAYRIVGTPDAAWKALCEVVVGLSGASVVQKTSSYLYVQCETPILGFIDDLEFQLRREVAQIAVRSASRLGYSDLGTNRGRVEAIRKALIAKGVVAHE